MYEKYLYEELSLSQRRAIRDKEREIIRRASLEILEEKGFVTISDIQSRIEGIFGDISYGSISQFLTRNKEDWNLKKISYGEDYAYVKKDIEKILSLTPEEIKPRISERVERIIKHTTSKAFPERRMSKEIDTYLKAKQLLQKGLGPNNAAIVYHSAKDYCNTHCNAPSNLNPMITCVHECEIWKVKNKALKLFS